MEAVTPYPLLIKRVGQRKGLLDLRRSPVKGGIEDTLLRVKWNDGRPT